MVTLKIQCRACQGSGVFVAMKAQSGEGSVCLLCRGRGWRAMTYTPFRRRKLRSGIERVHASGREDSDRSVSYLAFRRGERP